MNTVYISNQCPNCIRLLSTIRRIASLNSSTRIVDIDSQMSPEQRSQIEFVPTFATAAGAMFVGAKAFEYLKQYDGEIELDSAPLGGGSLAFGAIDDGDGLGYSGFYGEFTKPPE